MPVAYGAGAWRRRLSQVPRAMRDDNKSRHVHNPLLPYNSRSGVGQIPTRKSSETLPNNQNSADSF